MDGPFLKFWGEFLVQAAEGQRKVEEITQWVQSGFPSSGNLATLFRHCYGLAPGSSPGTDDRWQKATSDFQNALEAYAPLWGWVPLESYDQLKRENQRLETKIAQQERLIKQLEELLEDEDMGHMAMATRFHNLITDQRQAFDELMQALAPPADAPDRNHS